MKSVLISIQPRHVENICTVVGEKDGKTIYKKRIEVRRKRPKRETPFTVYIYQTRKHWVYKVLEWLKLYRGAVVGEFVCDEIEKIDLRELEDTARIQREACLTRRELFVYLDEEIGYLWHISDLKIYDKPKALRELGKACNPQSWCYVRDL